MALSKDETDLLDRCIEVASRGMRDVHVTPREMHTLKNLLDRTQEFDEYVACRLPRDRWGVDVNLVVVD